MISLALPDAALKGRTFWLIAPSNVVQPVVAMSTVAVAVWLPWCWVCPDPRAPSAGLDAEKAKVRRTLRLISGLTADHDQLLPVVGIMRGDGSEAPPPEWASDQEWHRGEFSLFVESTDEAVQARWHDVLSPVLPNVDPPDSKDPIDEAAHRMAKADNPNDPDGPVRYREILERWRVDLVGDASKDATNTEYLEDKARECIEAWLRGGYQASTRSATTNQVSPLYAYPPAPPGPGLCLNRLRKVDVTNIRGWVGIRPPLDTDADIILINAPNGRGKSSLLHAIALAVTGIAPEDASGSVSLKRVSGDQVRERHAEGAVVLEYDGGGPDPARLTFMLNTGQPWDWRWVAAADGAQFVRPDRFDPEEEPTPADGALWWPGTHMRRMLQYRLTAYFPEKVRDQFDHVQKQATLISHLRPLSRTFRALVNAAGVASAHSVDVVLRETLERRDTMSDDRVADLHRKLTSALAGTSEFLDRVSALDVSTHTRSEIGEARGAIDRILQSDDPCACLRRAIEGESPPPLPDVQQIVEALRRGRGIQVGPQPELEAAQAELQEVQNHIRTEEKLIQPGGELAGWAALLDGATAAVTATPKLLTALDILREIRDALPDRAPEDGAAARVHEELRLVVGDQLNDLLVLARGLHENLKARRARWASLQERERALLDTIRRNKVEIEDQDQARRRQEVAGEAEEWDSRNARGHRWRQVGRAWEDWQKLSFDPKRAETRESAEARVRWLSPGARAALDALHNGAYTQEGDRELVMAINGSTQRVLGRFAIAAGTALSKRSSDAHEETAGGQVHRYRDVSFADGTLKEADLSTGTRTQVAIAELVGQKLVALSEGLPVDLRVPNRVILLDDVSTAYDLTNLTREALLWRQLAFHPAPKKRLQIFISTHHDSMTNRLYDLLTPPHGCRVLVHQITGWSLDEGPKVESFELRACGEPNERELSSALHKEIG